MHASPFSRTLCQPLLVLLLLLIISPPARPGSQSSQASQKEKKKPPQITEEILVVGETPQDRPVSTVTVLDTTQIERIKPLDLSETIRYAPGVTVSFGDKSVYSLKLRGVDSQRIALLIDGIPVYEPYFSTFDLKTIATDGIDSLKLTRGPSSVLYGPNTLGGIVNVITQRPSSAPQLSLHASYGENNTRGVGLSSGFQTGRFALAGSLVYKDSDGFDYPAESGGDRLERLNSDYQRFNFNGKIYFNPTNSSEILLNAGVYRSQYGMPPGLQDSRPRYWRFKNWDRLSLNVGGFTALSRDATVRYRAYYVKYDNTLDMFRDPELNQQSLESTHDNAVYGFFGLADLGVIRGHRLKVSADYKGDDVRTQDDIGEPWNAYNQLSLSFGIEDHWQIFDDWQVVAGLSYDYLEKFIGENIDRLNPLLGIKFTPAAHLDLHASFARKSRFPSMRSLYSGSSGNPDLLSETGTIWELGFTYNREFLLTGSAFLMRFKDFIDSVRLPEFDFQRRYFNIAEARIDGFELQAQKAFALMEITANYTYLDHFNQSDERPLDAVPRHNLNFDIHTFPLERLRLGILGLWASSSTWLDFSSGEILDIPAYFNLDTILTYSWRQSEIFLKITNIFDTFIYTEPGFPWRSRYFELGIRTDLSPLVSRQR